MERLFTIGAYGFNERSFFDTVQRENIDLFLDLRRRRGIRGREYAFGNAARLQRELADRGIPYRHMVALAPTPETRALQSLANRENRVVKRKQAELARSFVDDYRGIVRGGPGVGH